MVRGHQRLFWLFAEASDAAISTVLNNPHKKQAPPKAHSLLPPVPPADLPRVRRKDFDSYLKAIAPEWERYEHNVQLGREGQALIEDNEYTPRNSLAGGEGQSERGHDQNHIQTSTFSAQGKYIPPLDSVPDVFFKKEFNLGDPKTFAIVTEQQVGSFQDDSDSLSLSHSLPLLEKFSHYADTVEQHLVREIGIRSTSFFAALTNLHDLQSESERCLDRISKLRTQLKDVDDSSAKRGLEMVRKESKMANLGKVRDGVKMVAGVVEMTGVAKGLVAAAQWGEALDIIQGLEKLWEGAQLPSQPALPLKEGPNGRLNGHNLGNAPLPPTPEEEPESEEAELKPLAPTPDPGSDKFASLQHSVPLSSLQAFSALPSHLRTLTTQIAASLSSELVSVLRSDLELRVQHGSAGANDQGLKDRLKPLLLNLVRTKGMKEGVLSWREVVLVEMRGIIKKVGFLLPCSIIHDFMISSRSYQRSTRRKKRVRMASRSKSQRSAQRNTFDTLFQIRTSESASRDVTSKLRRSDPTNLPATSQRRARASASREHDYRSLFNTRVSLSQRIFYEPQLI